MIKTNILIYLLGDAGIVTASPFLLQKSAILSMFS